VTGVVLTGEGRGFLHGRTAVTSRSEDARLGSAVNRLWRSQKPTLAAIGGPCSALGFAIALMCDVRFISDDAYCRLADGGDHIISRQDLVRSFRRMVSQKDALDLLVQDDGVSASRALALGLVQRVYAYDDLLDAAILHMRRTAPHDAQKAPHRLWSPGRQGWGPREVSALCGEVLGPPPLALRADHEERRARAGLHALAQGMARQAPEHLK
jgi:enoyl-CoA hydratase/carnithine racemase